MSDVFISYSRLDKAFVGKLRDALAELQQDIWIDWESIPPSQAWWAEIQKGIVRANNFVVVLSPNSMASPICQLEIEYARQFGKRIIPVLHLDFKRDEAISAIAIRLADPEQDATRQIWSNRQPHNVFDSNDNELKHINYFFFRPEDDFDERFTSLFEVIRTDFAHKEQHTTLELRALEWERRNQNVSFLLLDDELADAKAWLEVSVDKNPSPTELQRAYISASERRTRQLRNIRRASIIGSLIAVIAIAVAAAASLVGIQANTSAEQARTEVANANATLTPISVTLATANAQLRHATATLGYVQDQGTQVAAQATYFGIEQARIGTLSAGAVIVPPGTLTPELLLPTLTGIAQLRHWEPRIVVDDFGVEMVEVPPGCFVMGSITNADEQPVHEQCFTESFYIDRYEVTQAQFAQLGGNMTNRIQFPGEKRPVDNINWFEASDFCALHRGGRLPTEREWEYAARGMDSFIYPWGNTLYLQAAIFNRSEFEGTEPTMNGDNQPIRPQGASWVGALDMAGNVWEWTSTRYDELDPEEAGVFLYLFPYPYIAGDGREANETREVYEAHKRDEGSYSIRVLRGGSWYFDSNALRSALRYWSRPDFGDVDTGFRCVSDATP